MKILFRTEANHTQGIGDLLGCLALAEEADKRELEVSFLMQDYAVARSLLDATGYSYEVIQPGTDLSGDLDLTLGLNPDVVIVNKLRSPSEYICGLSAAKKFVVTIDDDGEAAAHADLRINPLYPTANAIDSFQYLMLRSEFQQLNSAERHLSEEVRHLIVMQGGADTYGFLPKIVRAIGEVAGISRVTVIIGPAFQHQAELASAVSSTNREIETLSNPPDLPQRMQAADLAITAGGLSMFELASVGTPSLVICAERFEVPTAARLEAEGAVSLLGFGADFTENEIAGAVTRLIGDRRKRAAMSRRGKTIVDGRGAARIMQALLDEHERREANGRCAQV